MSRKLAYLGITVCYLVTARLSSGDPHLYWVDMGGQTDRVGRANLDGSNPQVLHNMLNDPDPSGIAVDPIRQVLYWSSHAGIVIAELDASSYGTLIPSDEGAVAIDLDLGGGKIYWSNRSGIHRANLNGSVVETIVSFPYAYVDEYVGLSLDAAAGKLYFLIRKVDEVPGPFQTLMQRSNLDGSGLETLVDDTPNNVWGLAVDRVRRAMYWISNDHNPNTGTIRRANLDGSGAVTILDFGTSEYPHGLSLNERDGRLYWYDAVAHRIRRAAIDGSQIEDVVTQDLGLVMGLSVRSSIMCTPTAVFGDVKAPDGVSFQDIAATVDRFRELASAPPVAICDVYPCAIGWNVCVGDGRVDFRDITQVVNAYRGLGCQ